MGPNLRLAVASDAQALSALVNSAYRGESSKAGWTTEADLLGGQRIDAGRILDAIGTPGNAILLREKDGAPEACVHLERVGDECYLGMLTVRPPAQGAGIGARLLEAAEQWAIDNWQSTAVHMTVITQRVELIAWYERRGYTRTGETKPFPYGDERFGLPRRDDLSFVVMRKPL
jgi:GNAT superfamily N-acetyltransferase